MSYNTYNLLKTCPKRIELIIKKVPEYAFFPTYHLQLGALVQKVFEIYINQHLYKSLDNHYKILRPIIIEQLRSNWFTSRKLTYPKDKDFKTFINDVYECVKVGLVTWQDTQVFKWAKDISSEVEILSELDGIVLKSRVDFLIRDHQDGYHVYDGKCNQHFTADPEQLLFYGAILYLNSLDVRELGFLYWRYGWNPQVLNVKKIEEFIDNKLFPMRESFRRVTGEFQELPAYASKDNCRWCAFKIACPESAYKPDLR